jgi:CBS domain-containing protein
MKDVMLTDFDTLSPSDTLSDALYRVIHSLQDDFPVVRGPNLVGVVSKQSIVQALRTEGNGYIQGIMARGFQVAEPDDSLGLMIRRIGAGRMSLVPVAEEGRIVGIVTWQNLSSSMGLLAEHRRLQREV